MPLTVGVLVDTHAEHNITTFTHVHACMFVPAVYLFLASSGSQQLGPAASAAVSAAQAAKAVQSAPAPAAAAAAASAAAGKVQPAKAPAGKPLCEDTCFKV